MTYSQRVFCTCFFHLLIFCPLRIFQVPCSNVKCEMHWNTKQFLLGVFLCILTNLEKQLQAWSHKTWNFANSANNTNICLKLWNHGMPSPQYFSLIFRLQPYFPFVCFRLEKLEFANWENLTNVFYEKEWLICSNVCRFERLVRLKTWMTACILKISLWANTSCHLRQAFNHNQLTVCEQVGVFPYCSRI